MKLFRSANAFLSLRNLGGSTSSRISTAASASTETLASSSLFFRVTHDVDHRASILPILEKWVDEGRPLVKRSLQGIVKKLRKMKRHSHALEVFYQLLWFCLSSIIFIIHQLQICSSTWMPKRFLWCIFACSALISTCKLAHNFKMFCTHTWYFKLPFWTMEPLLEEGT